MLRQLHWLLVSGHSNAVLQQLPSCAAQTPKELRLKQGCPWHRALPSSLAGLARSLFCTAETSGRLEDAQHGERRGEKDPLHWARKRDETKSRGQRTRSCFSICSEMLQGEGRLQGWALTPGVRDLRQHPRQRAPGAPNQPRSCRAGTRRHTQPGSQRWSLRYASSALSLY